jgi:hypothetical protein
MLVLLNLSPWLAVLKVMWAQFDNAAFLTKVSVRAIVNPACGKERVALTMWIFSAFRQALKRLTIPAYMMEKPNDSPARLQCGLTAATYSC